MGEEKKENRAREYICSRKMRMNTRRRRRRRTKEDKGGQSQRN